MLSMTKNSFLVIQSLSLYLLKNIIFSKICERMLIFKLLPFLETFLKMITFRSVLLLIDKYS